MDSQAWSMAQKLMAEETIEPPHLVFERPAGRRRVSRYSRLIEARETSALRPEAHVARFAFLPRASNSMFVAQPPRSQRSHKPAPNGKACIMTNKLDVGKALDKLRGREEPKSRMTVLDEKNKALDEEIRRLRAERSRLERGEPEPLKGD